MADCEVLENKTLIQTVLSRLIQNKTVLVIVHRMRNIAGADKIVVLSDGTVAKQGAPDDLYRKNEERNGCPYGESASKQSKRNHRIKKENSDGREVPVAVFSAHKKERTEKAVRSKCILWMKGSGSKIIRLRICKRELKNRMI